jgi:cell division protein FtsB
MFVAAFAILIFFITATVYYFEFRRLMRLRSAVAESSARLAERERSVANYREKVAFYRTDEGMAHLAREQYNLVFPGERIFIVKGESSEASWR